MLRINITNEVPTMCVLQMHLLKIKWLRNLTIKSSQYMCIEKDHLWKMLRINITNVVPTMCVLPMNLLKINTGMKFNYHVPTIYVYRKRSSLKDIDNKHY